MRRIGMLGGMSWESTAEYYRIANELVRERLGGLHSADLLIASLDFDLIARLQTAGEWEEAGELLAEHARRLEDGGAELIVLCTNTMHKVAEPIERAISIPFLHIVDTAAAAIRRAGLTRVGLLGTAFTMEQSFYRDRLTAHGVEVVVPNEADRAEVHRAIYEELVLGVVSETSRERYRQIIARLVDDGGQGIVLGCTEIELLVAGADSPVPVFPTTRLHVEAAVEASLHD